MVGSRRAGTVMAVLAATACAGAGPGAETVSPVLELARLRATGQLDAGRLACAVAALPDRAVALSERLPALREAQRDATGDQLAAHRASVSENMRTAEAQTGAMQAALELSRSALYQDGQGNAVDAVRYWRWAGVIERRAEGDPGSGMAHEVRYITDDEAQRLVEYANLRASISRTGGAEASMVALAERVEAEDPVVVEAYAGMLLDAYTSPDLRCGDGDPPTPR